MTATRWRHGKEELRRPYHYSECGLDDVYLTSGYQVQDTDYGRGVSVKDVDGLHQAIGLWLTNSKKALSGKEVRFLRKELVLTQAQLGDLLGASNQSVARWEKGETEMPGAADLLLRVIYVQHTGARINARELAERLRAAADAAPEQVLFTERQGIWKARIRA